MASAVIATVEDVQSRADTRQLPINKVGIKDITHPVKLRDRSSGEQHTVATFNMYVNLPHDFKGTHMSRFVEILHGEREISVENFRRMLDDMTRRLEAEAGHIEMSFPFFVMKKAPVSGVESLMDYRATLIGEQRAGIADVWVRVVVPVTSLCPCSKRISERGAHNQRSHVTITAKLREHLWIEELIDIGSRKPLARCSASSSAPMRSTSPSVPMTIPNSSKIWCAISRCASTPSHGLRPIQSRPKTSSRSITTRLMR